MYDIEYSDEAKDLITQLLSIEPESRQTCEEIKDHPWFKDAKWQETIDQSIDAPIQPKIINDLRFPN